MIPTFPENQINYVLRMYLPPWNYEKVMADVIRFCKETETKHVLLFSDAQHMVWNQLTLKEARHEAENIKRAVKDLAEHGITAGINSSYNQKMSRFDHRKHNSQYTHWMTYADGNCEYRLPCLLDPALKEYLSEFYKILAGTGAEFIFIDDDHRYMCDGANNTWGCMCDLHISEFSKLTGKAFTRESLQETIFNDISIRKQWILFLKKTLDEIADTIENAIHSVNPDMNVGIMVPSLHCTTLWDYDLPDTARRFQPEGKLIMRPCIGAYSDNVRSDILPGLFYMQMIYHLMGDQVQYATEIETTPYTRFSISMEVVRLHICQGIMNRMFNPLISACGYVGNSPYWEPEFAEMLKREKCYFESLRKIAPEYGTKKGIGMLFDAHSALNTPNNHQDVSDYYLPAFTLHNFLSHCGFSPSYDQTGVTFLAGESVYSFSPEKILDLLKGNLILDSAAAKALADRGYLEYTGAETGPMEEEPFGAELYTCSEFCGQYTGDYIPFNGTPVEDVQKIIRVLPGTKVLTKITDHDLNEICPGITLFENKLGGKIAVMAIRIGPGTMDLSHLICYQKQLLMRNILNWMDPMSVPVFVEKPACFAAQYFDNGKHATIGFVNFSYDTTSEMTVTFTDPSLDVENGIYLNEDGQFLPLKNILERIDEKQWKIKKFFSVFHYFAIQIPKREQKDPTRK